MLQLVENRQNKNFLSALKTYAVSKEKMKENVTELLKNN